jgi:hypothetical protein
MNYFYIILSIFVYNPHEPLTKIFSSYAGNNLKDLLKIKDLFKMDNSNYFLKFMAKKDLDKYLAIFSTF